MNIYNHIFFYKKNAVNQGAFLRFVVRESGLKSRSASWPLYLKNYSGIKADKAA